MKRLAPLPLLFALGCTGSDLYVQNGNNPLIPDRIALTGQVCSENTSGSNFPVKVLFLVDTSAEMRSADPDQRLIDAPGGIDALVQANRNQLHVSFGFVGFNTAARSFPDTVGQQFLRPQDQDLIALAEAQLRVAPTDPRRDLTTAITTAESFITADVSRSAPGDVLRTRYVVFLLVAGPANPEVDSIRIAEQVANLRDLVYQYGALEFQLNIGLLYYGPSTIDQGVNQNFNCYANTLPSGDPNDCDCMNLAGDLYCTTWCQTVDNPPNATYYDDNFAAAQTLYQNIRTVGNGTLRTYNCPNLVDIKLPIASGSVNLVRKDILAFNRNVRISPAGPELDSDGDGLPDTQEVGQIGTDPFLADTDGDGVGDGIESRSNKNPLDPLDRPSSCPNPQDVGVLPDSDLDLLNDCEEGIIETSPSKPDTDGDGLTDFVEFMLGTLPTNPNDRLLDFDSDGVLNGDEVLAHTDPRINESAVRGTESYRTGIDTIGLRTIASMENSPELRAVQFLAGSSNIAAGQADLTWDPATNTLAWVDAHSRFPPFWSAVPVEINNGTGNYRLTARAPNGETAYIDVYVDVELLPDGQVRVFPLVSISDRNCYNARISNIKLMQTGSYDPAQVGINNVYVFFTQAPADRLTQPGIAQVAHIPVVFRCTNTRDLSSCARNPADAQVVLTSEMFRTAR